MVIGIRGRRGEDDKKRIARNGRKEEGGEGEGC